MLMCVMLIAILYRDREREKKNTRANTHIRRSTHEHNNVRRTHTLAKYRTFLFLDLKKNGEEMKIVV